jgi:hypothetical protein
MKKRYYIVTGVITYLAFLLATIPAAAVLSQIQKHVPTIAFAGVSGLLWNGTASAITINRQHLLSDTDWQLNGWRILSGELSTHVSTRYQQQPVSGDIGVNLFGKVIARDVNANMPASMVAQLAQMPLGEFGGVVAMQFSQLEWKPRQVPHATGTILWNNAAVSVAETAELGNITITLSDDGDRPIKAIINNRGGQIKLEGDANVGDDGEYSLQLTLLPNNTASRNIRSSLGMIAKPLQNGSYQINNKGNLKQLGII